MKSLHEYVYKTNNLKTNNLQEGLRIGINDKPYSATPASWKELKQIIEERYEQDGAGTEQEPIDFSDIDISKIDTFYDISSDTGLFSGMLFEYIDVSNWDLSNVKNISNIFYYCKSLKSVGDLSGWDVSNIDDMTSAFHYCENLKSIGDLSNWDVSNVKDMSGLFNSCPKLESVGDLSNWDVSNVEDMHIMFLGCKTIKDLGDLGKWHIDNCKDISGMFYSCKQLQNIGDLSNWKISKQMTVLNSLFEGCVSLKDVGDLNSWDVSHIDIKNIGRNFTNSGIENLPSWAGSLSEKEILDVCKKYDNGAYPDKPLRRASDPTSYTLAYKIWAFSQEGDFTKAEILTKFGLSPTSYATMFATMSGKGIIEYQRIGKKSIIKPGPNAR